MTFLFIGGEDIDFTLPVAGADFTTDTSAFRSTFARVGIRPKFDNGTEAANPVLATFASAQSTFWVSMRLAYSDISTSGNGGRSMVALYDGAMKRLALGLNDNMTVALVAFDDQGAPAVLTTSGQPLPHGQVLKLDLQVSYSGSGSVTLYANNSVLLSYTGAVAKGSATSLSALSLHSVGSASGTTPSPTTTFSEIIVATADTRAMSLATLAPDANGAGTGWTGAYTDIDEAVANDYDGITANTAEVTGFYGLSALPAGGFTVPAVKVAARASRGSTAPTNLQLGVRTGGASGTTGLGSAQAVSTGWTNVAQIFEADPTSNAAWTQTTVSSLEIALKSKA
jgi:hypothetical protein